jgi:hypothetical protein
MTKDANTDLHSESSLGKNICKLQQFADNLWVRGEGRREGKGLKPRCEELKVFHINNAGQRRREQ